MSINQSKESGSHFGHDCFTVINGESDKYNGNLKSSGAIISRYWVIVWRGEDGAKVKLGKTSWDIFSTSVLVSLLDLLHLVVQDVAEVLPPDLRDEDGVAEVALHLWHGHVAALRGPARPCAAIHTYPLRYPSRIVHYTIMAATHAYKWALVPPGRKTQLAPLITYCQVTIK